ncbi:hypothetical protein [uncultured Roseobacter sp.]|uniref:hypothetical protein n=1 Tax=uncultured Roseobacter sp. TaxID=114847 RepID=UPI0026399713|nr:hypothetical protein [uncultured Roseobacter sp.]
MKIVTDTPHLLVLEYRPWRLTLCLVAFVLFIGWVSMDAWAGGDRGSAVFAALVTLGLLCPALWLATERVQVIFDRREGACTLRRKRRSGYHAQSHPIGQITRAMVQTYKGGHDDPDGHRIALVLGKDHPDNRVGLTRSYRSGPQAEKAVDRINAWLDSARQQA